MWIIGWSVLTAVFVFPFVRRALTKDGNTDWFNGIYAIAGYFYLGVGIRGLLVCTGTERTPYAEVARALNADPWIETYTFLVAALGLAALYAGYFVGRKHGVVKRLARLRLFAGPHQMDAMLWICAAFGLVALLAVGYLWRAYASPGSITDPEALIERSAKGGQYILTGWIRFAFVGTLIAGAAAARMMRRSAWLVLALNTVAILFWFLISSGKASLLFVAFGYLVVWNYSRRRVRLLPLLLVAAAALYLYPVMVLYRYRGIQAFEDTLPKLAVGSNLLMERSHQFDLALLAMYDIREHGGLKYGSTVAELAYFYIPRAIWPSKPMSFGYRFGKEYTPAEFRMGLTGGETPSLLGELFLNVGVVGVVGGMFVFGVLLKELYVFLWSGGPTVVKVALYGMFVVDSLYLVEGPIGSQASTFILDLISVLFVAAAGRIALSPRLGKSASGRGMMAGLW